MENKRSAAALEPLEPLLKAFIFGGTAVFASTEILSAWRMLSSVPVILLWLLLAAAAIVRRPPLPRISLASASPFLLTLSLTLVVALFAPPNNWDSMTYHMARTSHWLRNATVAHYPTNIPNQLMMPPFAEYAITHLRLLAGGTDRLANLVQWTSYVVAMLAVYVIAARLTGKPKTAWLAALVVATTPMNILQATSTQNDLTCAAWVAAFAAFTIASVQGDRRASLWAGAALGLALATKNTAAMFAPPFLVYGAAVPLWRREYRPAARFVVTCLIAAALFVAPQLYRNWITYNDPIGDPEFAATLLVGHASAPATLSNAVRNLALQFATPWPLLNDRIASAVASAHNLFGLSVNDPNTTYVSWAIPGWTVHEDATPSLVVTILILAAFPLLLLRASPLRSYTACVLAGYLIFCALIKWQLWNSRFLVVFFVLSAVPIAVLLNRRRVLAGVVLTAAAIPWLLLNASRPLLPNGRLPSILTASRTDLYFANRWQEREAFLALGERIKQLPCRTLGIYGNPDTWEYPLWVLSPGVRVRHVEVHSASSRLTEPALEPECAVFAETRTTPVDSSRILWQDGPLVLMKPAQPQQR